MSSSKRCQRLWKWRGGVTPHVRSTKVPKAVAKAVAKAVEEEGGKGVAPNVKSKQVPKAVDVKGRGGGKG